VLIAAIAAATSVIRVGSGAVQLGHQTAVVVAEAFGTLSGLYPGRIDLGLGRSMQKRQEVVKAAEAGSDGSGGSGRLDGSGGPSGPGGARTVNGLLIPAHYSAAQMYKSPRFAAQPALLQQAGAQSADFGAQVDDILAFLGGEFRTPSGLDMAAVPAVGADAEVWILGSSAGQSAQVAGALGLPFAANYHVSPSTVLEAVEAYRAAFRPSGVLSAPHVLVSADVMVAPTGDEARSLAGGYPLWVRSIRCGDGAMPFPSPETVAAFTWTDTDLALVADRVATQFVGSPAAVARQLRVLQEATGADELLVTSVTHAHVDRVRSHELLAREWGMTAGLS
jgi:alkanesulfonate monooxygenase SsuD/methylene tetrahydromethanopterin reductase-like flavin-dependent oxidoreductase (luciferase family)